MKKSLFITMIIAGFIASCTTTQKIQRSDGSTEYLIACGASTGFNVCYNKANKLCPNGYKTLSENSGFNRKEVRVSCQGSGETITQTHYKTLDAAHTQQRFFRRNLKAGMSQEQVINVARQTQKQVSSDYSVFQKDGSPTKIEFNVVDGVKYEQWEFYAYDVIFVLMFQNQKLSGFTEKEGITASDVFE